MMDVWGREHGFYRDVAPKVTVRVPAALHSSTDPYCLILEDLAPGQPGDHVAGATLDQAERAVDAIAAHHAAWFDSPVLSSLAWLPGLDDPSALSLGAMFDAGWPAFLERYGDELPSRTLTWCERLAAKIPSWLGEHSHLPCTITHGDFRLDNIFYFDDGSVALIDWQMSMRAPGQSDLVYFCANNLSVEVRRAHETALIERYVDGLHRAGVPRDAVTLEGVTYGYLEGLLFYATTFAAGLLGIDPANERGAKLFDALVHRTFTAVDDLDVGHAMGL
jgi:aminoglycoside/choline kinase family phosphotransferase